MGVIALLIKYFFGYNPDDDDKMAELNKMSDTEGFFLLALIKTLGELEGSALVAFSGDGLLPVVGKNVGIIQKPMIVGKMKAIADLVGNMYTGDVYEKNDKKREITAGERKWVRQLQAYLPYNPFHPYNPDLDPIQAIRNLEGAKNMR